MKPLGGLVPFVRVADVQRSVEFYGLLGFTVGNSIAPGGKLTWAWLYSGKAHLMVSAGESVNAETQGVWLYLYADGVIAYREQLIAQGLSPSELEFPPHAPHGEFRLIDPDGYVLVVGDTEQM
jgi:hypothetical protein